MSCLDAQQRVNTQFCAALYNVFQNSSTADITHLNNAMVLTVHWAHGGAVGTLLQKVAAKRCCSKTGIICQWKSLPADVNCCSKCFELFIHWSFRWNLTDRSHQRPWSLHQQLPVAFIQCRKNSFNFPHWPADKTTIRYWFKVPQRITRYFVQYIATWVVGFSTERNVGWSGWETKHHTAAAMVPCCSSEVRSLM